MNAFNEKLEYQRMKNNFNKEDLADKLSITRQSLYNYLNGRTPNYELIQSISKVFPTISMDYWVNDSISKYDDFIKFDNKVLEVEEEMDNYTEAVKFSVINKKLDRILNLLTDK